MSLPVLCKDETAKPVAFRWTVNGIKWGETWSDDSIEFDPFGRKWKVRCATEKGRDAYDPLSQQSSNNDPLAFGLYLFCISNASVHIPFVATYEFFVKLPNSQTPFVWTSCKTSWQARDAGYGLAPCLDGAVFAETGTPPTQLTVGVVLYPSDFPAAAICMPRNALCLPSLHQIGLTVVAEPGHANYPDLNSIFESPNNADIMFRIDGYVLSGHSHIIMARAPSSALAAMFTHPMKEQQTRVVDIEDVSYDVFHKLLEFIYTGQTIVPARLEILTDLYLAVDKYQILTCKEYARHELMMELKHATSGQQFAAFGKLWFLSDDVLNIICLRGMLRDWEAVQKSDEWKTIAGNPAAFEEVMRLVAMCKKFRVRSDEGGGETEERKRKGGDGA
ncbi:hypothetical protein HDV00_003678 [Rhizophlyctis rosea]|nr:hypothetical protein HDV00_003678 [Rhizophlyctis rosea]